MLSAIQFSSVTQLCLTPNDPMDCSLQGSSIHGICQARVLEWGAIAFSIKMLVAPKVEVVCPFLSNWCNTHLLITSNLKALVCV